MVSNTPCGGGAFIIFFVLARFAALGAHDAAERRGLVSSMINGRKFFSEDELKELAPEMKSKGLGSEQGFSFPLSLPFDFSS